MFSESRLAVRDVGGSEWEFIGTTTPYFEWVAIATHLVRKESREPEGLSVWTQLEYVDCPYHFEPVISPQVNAKACICPHVEEGFHFFVMEIWSHTSVNSSIVVRAFSCTVLGSVGSLDMIEVSKVELVLSTSISSIIWVPLCMCVCCQKGDECSSNFSFHK